jgi:hypothetical protein
VNEQDDSGEDGDQQLDDDPVVPEQSPWSTQSLNQPGRERGLVVVAFALLVFVRAVLRGSEAREEAGW